MSTHDDFEAELMALLAEGQKIAAIKVYRDRTGAGLREAKEAVEALEAGEPLPALSELAAAPSGDASSLEWEVVNLLREGNKIAAIKLYRERTGKGLKEAKDAIEAIARDRGLASSGGGCLGVILFVAALLAASAVA